MTCNIIIFSIFACKLILGTDQIIHEKDLFTFYRAITFW